jgi:hypothetical protein
MRFVSQGVSQSRGVIVDGAEKVALRREPSAMSIASMFVTLGSMEIFPPVPVVGFFFAMRIRILVESPSSR